jgi:branched-chain amino acid aminotransferase
MTFPAWRNGTYCTIHDLSLSILDLGVIHSDATYDVLAVKQGRALALDQHLERFKNSCHGWRIPVDYTADQLTNVFTQLITTGQFENALVWVAATRGIPVSGNPRDLANCQTQTMAYAKPYFGFNKSNSARLCLSTAIRVPDESINQTYKNWAWQDLTTAQWDAIDRGYDSALLLSTHGFLTEGPGFNVAIVINDVVYAPKSNRLPGVTMSVIERICKQNSIEFVYADIDQSMLNTARDMFITSTAGDVIPVTEFENKQFTVSDTQRKIAGLMAQAWTQDEYTTLLRTI